MRKLDYVIVTGFALLFAAVVGNYVGIHLGQVFNQSAASIESQAAFE